jgi:hypothetical protein
MTGMILNEISVERLHFTCTRCETAWAAVYDVQHVEDGCDRDYYFHDALPCPDPTEPGVTVCPACRHGCIAVTIAARRAAAPLLSGPRREAA